MIKNTTKGPFNRDKHWLYIDYDENGKRSTRYIAKVVPDEEKPLSPPSLIQKAKNLARATGEHIKDGGRKVSDESLVARWDKCNACQFFKPDTDERVSGVCLNMNCGCNIYSLGHESLILPNKIRWASSQCPLKKPRWTRE